MNANNRKKQTERTQNKQTQTKTNEKQNYDTTN